MLLGLVSHGVGMAVFPGLSSEHGFYCCSLCPLCRHLGALPDDKPQLYADNLKCSAERPCALFESAWFTAQYVRLVGQDVSPARLVRMSLLVSVSFLALLSLFGRL